MQLLLSSHSKYKVKFIEFYNVFWLGYVRQVKITPIFCAVVSFVLMNIDLPV